jgi:hypothetical protein
MARLEEEAMKAGDHIRILKDGEWQHAIDLGDRTVIHFAAQGGVMRSRLDSLSAGAQKVEVVTHPERVYAPKMVVARAFSRFSDSAFGSMFGDSEAFAVWCKSGGRPPPLRNGVAASIRSADEHVPDSSRADDAAVAPVEAVEPARRAPRSVKKVVRMAARGASARRPKAAAKPAKPGRAKAAPRKAAAGAAKGKRKAGAGRSTPAARKAAANAAPERTKGSRRTAAAATSRSGVKRKGSARTPAGRARARRRA